MDKWKLKSALFSRRLTVTEFIQKLNEAGVKMSKGAYYKRVRGDVEFNLSEIKAIINVLKLSNDETQTIFFNEKVS